MKKDFSKPLALLLGTVVTVTTLSCTDTEEVTNQLEHRMDITAPVRVQVNDFTMSVDDIPNAQTRAAVNPGSYKEIQLMTLAFYASDGTKMFEDTQLKTGDSHYTTFGTFSCNLPIGTYTMLVIARDSVGGDEFALTSPTAAAYTSEKVRETFCKTQSVSVTSSAALDLSVTLDRIVPQLIVYSTDARPTGVDKIRTTYGAGGKGFNPTTGLAVGNTGYSLVNTINKTAVGETIGVKNFVFLSTDEQTMTITLEALDAEDNVLMTKVIPDVPLKRNRRTTLRGPVFTPSASTASFLLETSWLEGNTVTF
jgi:hypothetical protein